MSLRDKLKEQEKIIETRLFGMNQTVKIFCLSKASDLTILMMGPHGIAKSTLARLWSDTAGLSFRIVTSSEVDESLIAYIDPAIFRKENKVEMKRGELMTKDHILVDEFFLWNNRYRAKLHQLLEERTYAGLDVLTKTFTFATNPLTEYYAGQIEEYNYACYSEDTEILTTEGWKFFKDLKEDEKVFTLNPANQEIKIEQIKRKVVYQYSGPMYLLKSQQINLLVTPNHRMFIAQQRNGKWIWNIKEAKEIFGRKFKVLKTGRWTGIENERYSLDFMKIVGIYLAEGSSKTGPNGHYGICLSICEEGLNEEIFTLFRKMGYNPSIDKKGNMVVWNKELWNFFKPLGKSYEKYVPSELKNLPKEKLLALLEFYFKGDGWETDNTQLAKTVSKRLADDLQEIALKVGFAMNIHLYKGIPKRYSSKLKRTILEKHKAYTLSLIKKRVSPVILGSSNKTRSKTKTKEEWKEYQGRVWCVETENGILYVRRGGIPAWSGNTFDRIDIFLPIYQPSVASSQKMLRKFSDFGRQEPKLKQVIGWSDYELIRKEILETQVPPEVIVWLTLFAEELAACRYARDKFSISRARLKMFCAECNRKESICSRASCSKPRFLRATALLAKALAWYRGEKIVGFNDILEAIKFTLPHRLLFSKETSILEGEKEIQTIVTMFNEQMEMIKNRGILQKLEKIRSKALDDDKPVFLQQEANDLKLDLQEDLPYLNYALELIDYSKKRVQRFYEKKAESIDPKNLKEFRDELDEAGLDAYAKKDIIESIEERE